MVYRTRRWPAIDSRGWVPSSLRIISSCLKTVSSNAGTVATTVRSAGASVAASIAVPAEAERDQVLWAGFDKLELGPSSFKHVLLLGYINGFQVLDVEDSSNVCEMVSKRDGPVTYLQMQPTPARSETSEGFRTSHPLLLVVAGDDTNGSGMVQGGRLSALIRDNSSELQPENCITTPTVVRFYSLKSHNYVHVLRFRSAVYMVRCSPRIVAVALAAQIYCFDANTLENKFSVLTYPLQGAVGDNIGYGPMAVGPRWLAYASNNPLLSNTGRLSPQNLTPSPGVSPSTSPGNGSLVARYAMESSKHLAAGILNLGDMGYRTLSKYCQERPPDGSTSPLSSNSSKRFGRVPSTSHPSEADNAGMVVVKDFVSKEVISQFRAHTSPISALCFDPSGTLLVTASVHGHNINVFRIMPTCVPNASGSVRYDWASSHVHLYKLYRGLTTAVIQDICFSSFSQWIAIVSSRGTCHIFVLSPFGGDASLQQLSTYSDGPSLIPTLTLPWWSASSYVMDQQFLPPPSPMTLSVVSRIKNSNSGWLNTVSNVAASAAGKVPVPSGAMAAVFHNSVYHRMQTVHSKANSLEHLLIYSPSGHLIQHELLPSTGAELTDSSSRTSPGSLLQLQDDDHVNAEPVQWWDVCRRSNWPEREENISKFLFDSRPQVETVIDVSDCEKSNGRPHLYLSNAEVQVYSGRVPIWQKSKICFYVMVPSGDSGKSAIDCTGGEVEIEKIPLHEVEIRRKDLLPVFERFHRPQSFWGERGHAARQCEAALSDTRDQFIKHSSCTDHSKSASLKAGSDDGLSSTTANFLEIDGVYLPGLCKPVPMEKPFPQDSIQSSTPMVHCEGGDQSIVTMPSKYSAEDCNSFQSKHSSANSLMDGSMINGLSSENTSRSVAADAYSSSSSMNSEVPNACMSNGHLEHGENADSHNSVEFPQYFHEGYCKVSEVDDYCESTGAVIDANSSSIHCGKEKQEEVGDSDDMLGGVFAFSEEDTCETG
ncbi:uncharacterized protein A4U43_C07F9290 [Asparagus officinalis]|uniref:Uncharacterized protein n=1 Tax=Asparagus officinalis TaxID=4686 RepID=A0A5P1EFQ0_ASPOF|nr:autophagy-related protein 18h-like [Asparagus officinalis]ONK62900.1 uncharacterized protein A4U43_C07F9290 [Asparagus officinalis]